MWHKWQKKTLVILGVLALVFASGIATQSAYALFQGGKINSHGINTTFSGMTAEPYEQLEDGFIEVELMGNRFLRGRSSQMSLTLFKQGSFIFLTDQTLCNETVTGWCIGSRDQSWAFHPQLGGQSAMMDNTFIFWGAGSLEMLDDDAKGMTDYKALIEIPEDSADPLNVVININGFAFNVSDGSR